MSFAAMLEGYRIYKERKRVRKAAADKRMFEAEKLMWRVERDQMTAEIARNRASTAAFNAQVRASESPFKKAQMAAGADKKMAETEDTRSSMPFRQKGLELKNKLTEAQVDYTKAGTALRGRQPAGGSGSKKTPETPRTYNEALAKLYGEVSRADKELVKLKGGSWDEEESTKAMRNDAAQSIAEDKRRVERDIRKIRDRIKTGKIKAGDKYDPQTMFDVVRQPSAPRRELFPSTTPAVVPPLDQSIAMSREPTPATVGGDSKTPAMQPGAMHRKGISFADPSSQTAWDQAMETSNVYGTSSELADVMRGIDENLPANMAQIGGLPDAQFNAEFLKLGNMIKGRMLAANLDKREVGLVMRYLINRYVKTRGQ